MVERFLGKEEVPSSILGIGSNFQTFFQFIFFYKLRKTICMRTSFFFILIFTPFFINSQELELDYFGEIVEPFKFITSGGLAIISSPYYTNEFISKLDALEYGGFSWIENQTDDKVYFAGKAIDHTYVDELRSLINNSESEYARRSAQNALSLVLEEIDKVILRNAKYAEDYYFHLLPHKLEDLLTMSVEYNYKKMLLKAGPTSYINDCNEIIKEISSIGEGIYKELNMKNLKEIQSVLGTDTNYFNLKLTCIQENKKSSWVYLVIPN